MYERTFETVYFNTRKEDPVQAAFERSCEYYGDDCVVEVFNPAYLCTLPDEKNKPVHCWCAVVELDLTIRELW